MFYAPKKQQIWGSIDLTSGKAKDPLFVALARYRGTYEHGQV